MYTRKEIAMMVKKANTPLREAYIGDLETTDMRITREANGDVLIEGLDPGNMGRLNQMGIRMSADEWEIFKNRFESLAKFI